MPLKHLLRSAVILALGLIAGCSAAIGDGTSEGPTLALDTLTAALDAWLQGEVATLSERSPAIRFEDDDCIAGWQLAAYELEFDDAHIEPYQNVRVNLTLKDKWGRAIERQVGYQVSLAPRLAVLRSE